MKVCISLCLLLFTTCAMAQVVKRDGVWLKNGIDAYDRTFVLKNGSDQDVSDALILVAYVSGMLEVHRQNNLNAGLIAMGANSGRVRKMSEADAAKVKIALFFAPLLKVPDDLSPPQVVAILRKYLSQNPAKWTEPAHELVTDAFVSEYPVK
jgi:hypothetical protein